MAEVRDIMKLRINVNYAGDFGPARPTFSVTKFSAVIWSAGEWRFEASLQVRIGRIDGTASRSTLLTARDAGKFARVFSRV